MAAIHGSSDPEFNRLRDILQERLSSGDEVGASICVNIDGRNVLDIWGGHADAAKTRPWEEDTLVVVYSCSKVVCALAALILVDRGLLDVEENVSKYWPEFAANGKEDTKVWHILSHCSGVPHWNKRLPLETIYDTKASTEMLAEQAPWFKAGEASAYQMQFIADEIAGPLDADFRLGVPEKDWPRTADMISPPPTPLPQIDPQSVAGRVLANLIANAEDSHTPEFRAAEVGSSNGFTNARALARIGSIASLKGTVDGKMYIGPKSIDQMIQERISGLDQVLFSYVRFGLGVGLPVPGPTAFIPEGNICFWGGWGGSIVVMDLDRRMTVAYTMNKMGAGLVGNDKVKAYLEAIYEIMAAKSIST
ncbi:unnamed protein product [Penicillium glandicola]